MIQKQFEIKTKEEARLIYKIMLAQIRDTGPFTITLSLEPEPGGAIVECVMCKTILSPEEQEKYGHLCQRCFESD